MDVGCGNVRSRRWTAVDWNTSRQFYSASILRWWWWWWSEVLVKASLFPLPNCKTTTYVRHCTQNTHNNNNMYRHFSAKGDSRFISTRNRRQWRENFSWFFFFFLQFFAKGKRYKLPSYSSVLCWKSARHTCVGAFSPFSIWLLMM